MDHGGTVDTALLRLGQRGWIRSSWGVFERNRKPGSMRSRRRGAVSWRARSKAGSR